MRSKRISALIATIVTVSTMSNTLVKANGLTDKLEIQSISSGFAENIINNDPSIMESPNIMETPNMDIPNIETPGGIEKPNMEVPKTMETPQVIETPAISPIKITNVKVGTNAPTQVLVSFDIDQSISLKVSSKDNIIIEAVNKNTGEILKTKSKTWTDYLNAPDGTQYGLGEEIQPGNYSTVFSESQLKATNPNDVVVKIRVTKSDVTSMAQGSISGEVAPEITFGKIVDTGYSIVNKDTHGKDAITIRFTIDNSTDLSKYMISIASETKEKYTGILWRNFLVNAETGKKYGLDGVLPKGTYLIDFKVDEIDQSNNYEEFYIKVVEKSNEKATGNVVSEAKVVAEHPFVKPAEDGGELPMPEVIPSVDITEESFDTIIEDVNDFLEKENLYIENPEILRSMVAFRNAFTDEEGDGIYELELVFYSADNNSEVHRIKLQFARDNAEIPGGGVNPDGNTNPDGSGNTGGSTNPDGNGNTGGNSNSNGNTNSGGTVNPNGATNNGNLGGNGGTTPPTEENAMDRLPQTGFPVGAEAVAGIGAMATVLGAITLRKKK